MVWYFVAERGKMRESCSGKLFIKSDPLIVTQKGKDEIIGRHKVQFHIT